MQRLLATVGGKKLIHERNSQFFFFARIATEKPEVGKEEVGLELSEREREKANPNTKAAIFWGRLETKTNMNQTQSKQSAV
jgi:hypothetical protein